MKNPIPQGNYVPAVRTGDLIVTAGMTPRKDGVLIQKGKVMANVPLESYQEAVRLAAQNALTAAKNQLKGGEIIQQVLLMNVYVNAAPDFLQHPKLADFASAYLQEELGKAGMCARCALGMGNLPGDAPVEINLMVSAGPEPDSVDFGASPYHRLRYELK